MQFIWSMVYCLPEAQYHPLSCFYFALSIFDVPVELVSIPSAILTKINQLDIEFDKIG
jgi:hypothetical protein